MTRCDHTLGLMRQFTFYSDSTLGHSKTSCIIRIQPEDLDLMFEFEAVGKSLLTLPALAQIQTPDPGTFQV